MSFIKTVLYVTLSSLMFASCKESEQDLYSAPNKKRVVSITEYNNNNNAFHKIEFTYTEDRVVNWHYFLRNDLMEWEENKRVDIKYNTPNITVSTLLKQNSSWVTKQICVLKVMNNQIHERTISRTIFPACSNCWKYSYTYVGSQMVEWKKYVKTDDNSWEINQKIEYKFEYNKLFRRYTYMNSEHGGLRLDYVRKYFHANNQLTGWQSGIYIEDKDWTPTEKAELTYEGNNVIAHDFLVWNANIQDWHLYGSVTYLYDTQGFLLEENTSEGNKTVYKYEPGSGNTSLLFYTPDCLTQSQPTLKSAGSFH